MKLWHVGNKKYIKCLWINKYLYMDYGKDINEIKNRNGQFI